MTNTKRLCRIALLGAFMFVIFLSLSNILYLEAITLMVITVSMVFDRSDSFLSCLVLGCLLIIYMGLTPWSIMYLIIYPLYSLLTSLLKSTLKKHSWLLVVYGFILAFSTGMLLDLPYILVSKTITILYIFSGLKVSLIQGVLCAIEITLIYEPLEKILTKIKEC